MTQLISSCGIVCSECPFLGKQCDGCYKVKGSTFWAQEMIPDKTCPLYACAVNEKKFKHCGECNELPCATFKEMKDPNCTEEEHRKALVERVQRLKTL
jgi:hypothetical protein